MAAERGPQRCDTGALSLVADATLDEHPTPEILVVPGGPGSRDSAGAEVVEWIRAAHPSTRWTTSVCTGSLLLGAAGVLDGLRATSHWLYLEQLRADGAEPTSERVVREGKVIPRPGSLRASTWRLPSPRSRPGTTSLKRFSSRSSTTPSRPSTPARPPRRPRRWSNSYVRWTGTSGATSTRALRAEQADELGGEHVDDPTARG